MLKKKGIEDILGYSKEILEFQDKFNSLKMYPYLREIGFDKKESLEIVKDYESKFYAQLIYRITKRFKKN